MTTDDPQQFDTGALAVEAAVIAVLGTQIISFETAWSMDWIFELAFVLTIIFYAIRTASLMADDPNQSALRLTILWSPISMQFCVIGAIAGLAVDITQYYSLLQSPVINFTLTTTAVLITIVAIDEYFLGEYLNTWIDTIREQSGDNIAGRYLRESAQYLDEILTDIRSGEQGTQNKSLTRLLTLLVILFLLFALVSSPLWLIGGQLIDSTALAIVVLFPLWFIRDLTRYMYFNYGPAQSFDDVNTRVPDSLIVMIVAFIITTQALGLNVI